MTKIKVPRRAVTVITGLLVLGFLASLLLYVLPPAWMPSAWFGGISSSWSVQTPFRSCFASLGRKQGNGTNFNHLLQDPALVPGTPLLLSGYNDRKEVVELSLKRHQVCQMSDPNVRPSPFQPVQEGPVNATIPHILHQSWKHAGLPDNFARWAKTWRANHPNWEYHFWTDDDNRNLIATEYPEILWIYDFLPRSIIKADFMRLVYMYHFGGVYVDMDFESVKSLDHHLEGASLILARMGNDVYFEDSFPNAFMASAKGHPFWLEMIKVVGHFVELDKAHDLNVATESYAGPRALFDAFTNYLFRADCAILKRVRILDPHIIFPLDWRHAPWDTLRQCREEKGPEAEEKCKRIVLTENSVAITYW